MYKEIMVWKRLDSGCAVRYCCFEDLSVTRYAVQSADFFRLPLDEKQLSAMNKQFVVLFIEEALSNRCRWFETIEQAIKAHDQDFS